MKFSMQLARVQIQDELFQPSGYPEIVFKRMKNANILNKMLTKDP